MLVIGFLPALIITYYSCNVMVQNINAAINCIIFAAFIYNNDIEQQLKDNNISLKN